MLTPTHSAWEYESADRLAPPLAADAHCDVCVIGGGIAGLTTAYFLAQRGQRVLVLEAQPEFAAGESRHTTAHLSWVLDDRFAKVAQLRGDGAAITAAASHRSAIERIGEIAAAENIACGYERLPGYLFPGADGPKILDEEEAVLQRLGLPYKRLERIPFATRVPVPCLQFPDQGQFHPLRYLTGLVAAVRKHGGILHAGTRVVSVTGGTPATVRTHAGATITAKAVVVATNAPFDCGVTLHTKLAAYTTYAVSFDLPAQTLAPGLYWDTEHPYHYVRTAATQHGEQLIVGGEDHKTGQASDQSKRWDRLAAWATAHFPALERVRDHWSGQVFETPDGLGLLGAAPGVANLYVITGDSGMGMTHGTIGAELVADLLTGSARQELVDLYAPGRVLSVATLENVSENLNVAAQYAAWVTSGEVTSAADVRPGSGAVAWQGLHKVAHYRDEQGHVQTTTAVCPHLGGIVCWNAGEQTWDCPLHGSRFSCTGAVLHGPAVVGLKSTVE